MSPSRGWTCGYADQRWKFFTKVPNTACGVPSPPLVPSPPTYTPATASGTRVCIANEAWEFTDSWDCVLNDIESHFAKVPAAVGWEESLSFCAGKCAALDDCLSFNFPNPGGAGFCFIKHTHRMSL